MYFSGVSRLNYFLIFVFLLGLLSCGTSRQFAPAAGKSLSHLWDSLDMANSLHTGIAVYDLDKGKNIFSFKDDNYFTPASTVKIFTLFAALHTLNDYVPAGYYLDKGDTIFIWGGGDPGTKYPDPDSPSSFIDFLKSREETIIFSKDHFRSPRLGRGWAWDDFPYTFQAERNAYPLYGNQLWIKRSHDTITILPNYFTLVVHTTKDTLQKLYRNELGTRFEYRYDFRKTKSLSSMPLSLFENDVKGIWREATGKEIFFDKRPFVQSAEKINGTHRDTLLRLMMHESDNFVAEQILLASAMQETGRMDEREIIKNILSTHLQELPDSITWVDGSGLSRYNLLTPRSVVHVLEKIVAAKGLAYVKSIFAGGGESGTLENVYRSETATPYLYAKTGSMRNVYCISGILITRTSNVLLFSWMNNHFNGPSKDLVPSIERFLTYLRDHY